MVSGAPKEGTLTMNRKKKAKAVKKTKKQAQSLERYGVSRPESFYSLVYSALAATKRGMSGSASFQSEKKS